MPISLKGVQENDFAMVMGYLGRTNRWMPASGIEQNIKFAYPAWVEGAKLGMDRMKVYMDKDEKVKLQYASKYASTANYWKNRQGMIDALNKAGTVKTKTAEETKFNEWANKAENKEKYGNVVATINNYYAKTNLKSRHDNYLSQLMRTTTYGPGAAALGKSLIAYYNENDAKRAEMLPRLNDLIERIYGNFYAPLEIDIFIAQLNLYTAKGAEYGLSPELAKMKKANKGNFEVNINEAVAKSIFATKETVLAFMSDAKAELIAADPLYVISNELTTKYRAKSEEELQLENDYEKGFRNLVEGLRESKIN